MLAHGGQGITPKIIKEYMALVGRTGCHSNVPAHHPDVKVLICKWLASTDQTVKTVQTTEFRGLFPRDLPNGNELLASIKEMADKVMANAKQAIEGLVGGVALSVYISSLATSKLQGSNVVAAVLAHYISPEGMIGQQVLALDLVKDGPRSISDYVWSTMESYQLHRKARDSPIKRSIH
ncbi:hypothetical protein PM082_012400 [Marasmius tenuissimus]|nr:hypothetical protein PM082_012400 [Marasmius tenuissimus]